jgi:uncharacterized OB-fold protein
MDLTSEIGKEAVEKIRGMTRLDGPGRVVLHFRDDKSVVVEGTAVAATLHPTRYLIRPLDTDGNDNDYDDSDV